MAGKFDRLHDYARVTLAGIRLFNGVAALFVPATLARRLGVDPEANPAAIYVLRLFGTRTVLIGVQLLLRDGELRAHSLRVAPAIHALDAAAIISTINTVLAIIAQTRQVGGARHSWGVKK